MGRAIDLLITYRVIKLLTTPWEKHEAFKFGIIDKKGLVLRKSRELKTQKEKNAYTLLHRFIFNLKRMLQKVGLGSRIASFGVALALLLREGKFNDESKYLLEDKLLEYLKKKKLFSYNDIKIKEQYFSESNCFEIVWDVSDSLIMVVELFLVWPNVKIGNKKTKYVMIYFNFINLLFF